MNTIASDTLVEAVARGIAKAKGVEICSDASYRHSTFGPLAQAALTAIADAGFVCVPREPTEAMQWAGWRAKDAIFSGDAKPMIAPSACYRAMIAATNNGKAE